MVGVESAGAAGAAGNESRGAEEVVAELDRALRAVGVNLPSLGVDPVSELSRAIRPLIELGRCNLDTARRLVDVLAERRP
ncbi:hypothetical protein AB0D04_10665 [Streptomyces sp. NPDC048483]|uniref:hypothetical protein n=1 Tax=Streptomyces sp. NPDC048483 TaxID=3154927 RepID=UPI0034257166